MSDDDAPSDDAAEDAGFNTTCPACKGETVEEIEDRGIPFLGCTSCFGLFATVHRFYPLLGVLIVIGAVTEIVKIAGVKMVDISEKTSSLG